MYFYGSASIVIGIFLIISFILLLKENNDKKAIKHTLIIYAMSGIVLIIVGILSFFNFFNWWRLMCIAIMVIMMFTLVVYITYNDRKGKKKIKLKTIKENKKKIAVSEDKDTLNDSSEKK